MWRKRAPWSWSHFLEHAKMFYFTGASNFFRSYKTCTIFDNHNTTEKITWCLMGKVYFTHVACCIVSSSSSFFSLFFTFSFSSRSIAVIRWSLREEEKEKGPDELGIKRERGLCNLLNQHCLTLNTTSVCSLGERQVLKGNY